MAWRGAEYEGEFPSLGWQVLEWWEWALRVPNGPEWGKPFVATDEQADYIVRLYRIDPRTGRFVYRRSAKREVKGKGKSPEAAALAIGEFAGPVVFDGWDAAGEPVGKPPVTPWVQVAACSEEQTGNTYSHLFEMLRDSPAVDELAIDLGKTRVNFYGRPGLIEAVTSSAGSREGQPVTFAVLDETHLWLKSNGGKRLAATMRRNVAKMNGRTVETTNAFVPGEGSVAEDTHDAAMKGEKGLLYVAKEAPWVEDLADRKALRKALEVAYGEARWVDLDRLVEEIQDPATDPADARRFYLNQLVKGESLAVDPQRWDSLTDADRVVADGEAIGLGFDGSISGDATALIGVTADRHRFLLGLWERPTGPAGKSWRVPRAEVHALVADTFARYRVGLMLCDPPKWETEVEDWAALYGEDRVLAVPTYSSTRFAPMCSRLVTAVDEGVGSHDGNERLRAHVLAMARKKVRIRDDDGDGRTRFVFVKADTRKIDAGIALTLAEEAAATMPIEPPHVKPRVLSLADVLAGGTE